MKKVLFKRIILLITIFFEVFHFSMEAQKTNWTIKNPGQSKGFIENKGQFSLKGKLNSNEILFALSADNVGYYFTKKGYVIAYAKQLPSVKKKRKNRRRPEDEDEDFEAPKYSYQYHEVEFLNANTKCSIEGLDKQLNYYSYGFTNETENKQTLIANSYKEIIYKNIYPNTDLLFEFKDDTCGIKYSFILYPGANADMIKMQFPLAKSVVIDKDKNLSIESSLGTITEYSPKIIEQNKATAGYFNLKNKISGFAMPHDVITDTTIIDPWVIIPVVTDVNKVIDVDYDSQGNVYAAIGGYFFSSWNALIAKYNSSGVLQWVYGLPFSVSYPFGDFAVDRRTNTIFAGEGLDNFSGAKMVKINLDAIQSALYNGDKNFYEIWRIVFDNCCRRGVVSGGGISWPTFQTVLLDTTLTTFNFINFSGTNECCHDVNMLALDNYGNSYQTTVEASSGPGMANKLTKLPLPGFLPFAYSVNTNYDFEETTSIKYTPIGVRGFNGITISDTLLYLYDSYVLKKFGTANGNLLNLKRISYPSSGDSSKIYCGGLTSNDCNDIFLGDKKTVRQYDGNLNPVNSFVASDTIFDMKLDLHKGNLLYVGGKKFLSSIQINGLPNCGYTSTLNITTSAVNEDCINKGSGNVVITGSEPPYTVQWNTNPVSTGTAVTGLSTGSYVVSVTDNACYRKTVSDTIYVGLTNNLSTSITTSNNSCNSINNGSANVSITSGAGPFNYAWSTGQSGTVSALTNLSAGNYSVVISSGVNCKDTLNFSITEPVLKDTLDIYTTYCEKDQQALLKLNSTISTNPYTWYNLTTAVNNSNAPELSVPVSDINLYSLTWFYNGCRYKTSAIQVTVIKDLEPDDLKFTNVFTPNDDGINDVFYPISRSAYPDLFYSLYDYELIILNRWGLRIFSSNLRGNVWDGRTESGESVTDGNYFWILNYKNKCGEKPDETKTIKGVVQLIR